MAHIIEMHPNTNTSDILFCLLVNKELYIILYFKNEGKNKPTRLQYFQ